MKNFLDRIHFEYLLLIIIAAAALALLQTGQIYSIIPMLAIGLLLAWKINLFKGIFCIVFLLLLAVFNRPDTVAKPDSLHTILNGRPVYGKIRFEITDPLCCSLPRIKNGATMQISIHEITTFSSEKYRGKGKFLIYAKNIIPNDAKFGDIYEISGTLRFAETQNVWNSDIGIADNEFRFGDFNKYMQLRNISGTVSPERDTTIIKIAENKTYARSFILFRDHMLNYTARHLSDANANLIGALFFGLKGALNAQSKQQFIKSGTIHLFSVSGLHVGILYGIILTLMFFLPIKRRYTVSALLLIPFLLSTGSNVPAVRAFLMLLVFSLLRDSCFYIPPLRILAGGCSAFLIYDINYLSDAGFLYSFGITGILLLLSEKLSRWNRIWNTDNSLKAVNRKNPVKYGRKKLRTQKAVFALSGTAAAFAGGSLITLICFGYLYLSAVWINFFILFYSTFVIILLAVQVMINPIIVINSWCGKFFDCSLDIMTGIIDFGADYPCQINSVQISLAGALLFYSALAALLINGNKKIFVTAAVVLISFFPCAVLCRYIQKSELLAIHDPSSCQTAFVLANPQGQYAWAYNIQDNASMELARKFLSSKGINHLNLYIQHGSAKNKINALQTAVKNMKIKKIVHISRTKLSPDIKLPDDTIYDFIYQFSTENSYKQRISRFFRKKNQFGFEYFDPEAIIPLYAVFDTETQTLQIEYNGKKHIKKWLNSNFTEYSVYEL